MGFAKFMGISDCNPGYGRFEPDRDATRQLALCNYVLILKAILVVLMDGI